MNKAMTYLDLIKYLNDRGWESVGTSDAVRSKNHVFLYHRKTDALITLPTVDSIVLPPHLAVVKKVLTDNGQLKPDSFEFMSNH